MFNRLKLYVTPPVFEDEEKTRAASLLFVVLWTVPIGVVAYALVAPLTPSVRSQALILIGLVIGLTLGGMIVLRRGHVQSVSIAMTSGIWLIFISAAFINGGVRAPIYSGCIIVVLIAGLLLGWRAGFLAVIATVAAGGGMLWLALNGRLPAWDEANYLSRLWLAQSAFLTLSAVLLAMALRTMNRVVQRALREVAERTRAEEALRDSEQRFRAIFDSVNDAIFVHELESGRILAVNRRMCEMYGYTSEEACQLTVGELSAGYEPYRQQDALHWLARAAAGESQIFDWLAKDRQGQLFWIEVNMRLAMVDGQERVLVVARDIAERKQAERVQTALYRISEVAQTTKDLDELYPAIHAIIGLLMHARNFYIALYDSATDLMTVPYMMDEFDRAWPPYRPGRGLSTYVLRTGQPLLATPEVFAQLEAAGEVEILIRSMVDWLGVPLKTPRGILGVMAIQTYSLTERLKEADKDILMFVSGQVAMAIERKRVEEALRFSEAKFNRAFHATPVLMSIENAEHQFVDVNEAFTRALGYSREEALGRSASELLIWADVTEMQLVRQAFAEEGAVKDLELHFRRRTGETGVILMSAEMIELDGAQYALTTALDITDRKLAEEAVRHSNLELQRHNESLQVINEISQKLHHTNSAHIIAQDTVEVLVKYSQSPMVAFFTLDAAGGNLDVLAQHGFDADTLRVGSRLPVSNSLSGLTVARKTVIPIDDVATAEHVFPGVKSALLRQGVRSAVSVPLIFQEEVLGVVNLLFTAYYQLADYQCETLMSIGKTIGLALANARYIARIETEIAERKQAEESLRRSEAQLRLVTENMADAISQIDAQYQLVYVSPSIQRVFGYAISDLLEQSVFDHIHPDDTSHVLQHLIMAQDVLAASIRIEYRYQHAAGHYLWVESEVRLLYAQAEFAGAVLGTRDISSRKQFEIDREALIEELESKNADLERFTYTVSHDLKSPLITIRGFLGFIEQDVKSGAPARFNADLARIVQATTQMQRLLDELLELSRIGRLSTKRENVSLTHIAQEAVELVQGRILARGVQVDIAPDMPVVYGERARLVEVLQNLVDNAVKFMGDQPEPRITIGALGAEDAGLPIFFVQDNGIGIDPRYHARVFGLFDKLDARSEGTGIGLALVKRIIDVHGGQIWVESEGDGSGTTFFFTLPRPQGR